jgi:hypothetical protein
MKKITPLVKGVITAAVMLILVMTPFYTKVVIPGLPALVYGIYAGGIAWTLIMYSKSPAYQPKFKEIFGQGFRCFIVVTLIMVSFSVVFIKLHPEFEKESTALYKEELIKKKNKTPAEIEKEIENYKKGFTTSFISSSIFGYLVSGAVFTVAGTALLLLRKKI